MRRREFIAALGYAGVAWPLGVRAQTSDRVPRIGYLAVEGSLAPAFTEGLRDLGYIDSKTVHIEFRSADDDDWRLARLAAELVRSTWM
jgi:putative ABC transport system substrate-binding protein